MALQNEEIVEVYGGQVSRQNGAGVSGQASGLESNLQGLTEVLAVGTTRRVFRGPKINGRFSLQTIVDVAGGAGTAMTLFYSNLPNPSLASDNDWAAAPAGDFTAPAITGTGNFWNTVNNADPMWVMVKIVVATSTANMRVLARVEGTNHGKVG